jgi:CRP/FNR family cyclic AMP-dependent transcriptional regulator
MRKVLHLLGILDDIDLEWIAHYGVQQSLTKNEVLVTQGVPLSALYILLEGQLSVLLSGVKETIARLLPGEVIGEISFVDALPPSATVVAAEDSLVLALPADLLREKLNLDRSFAAHFYQAVAGFLAARLRTTTRNLGYGKAVDRTDVDELGEQNMEDVSLAMFRFDRLLQQVRGDYTAAKV